MLVLVLLPFWTSILVRTAAWTVLLQKFGLLNDLLLWLGLTSDRLELMYSRTGLIIAMTHIQLPFTLLPIYSVMRSVTPSLMRAAQSLGARPFTAFWRVYLPQVMPGVLAGCLLTFILCLGYYITPVLIGGASDQLISNFIANYVNVELNWEMAAALSFVLLASTLGLYVHHDPLSRPRPLQDGVKRDAVVAISDDRRTAPRRRALVLVRAGARLPGRADLRAGAALVQQRRRSSPSRSPGSRRAGTRSCSARRAGAPAIGNSLLIGFGATILATDARNADGDRPVGPEIPGAARSSCRC